MESLKREKKTMAKLCLIALRVARKLYEPSFVTHHQPACAYAALEECFTIALPQTKPPRVRNIDRTNLTNGRPAEKRAPGRTSDGP